MVSSAVMMVSIIKIGNAMQYWYILNKIFIMRLQVCSIFLNVMQK